jgi:hypothetical protein
MRERRGKYRREREQRGKRQKEREGGKAENVEQAGDWFTEFSHLSMRMSRERRKYEHNAERQEHRGTNRT